LLTRHLLSFRFLLAFPCYQSFVDLGVAMQYIYELLLYIVVLQQSVSFVNGFRPLRLDVDSFTPEYCLKIMRRFFN
jgi:hypothetical protein